MATIKSSFHLLRQHETGGNSKKFLVSAARPNLPEKNSQVTENFSGQRFTKPGLKETKDGSPRTYTRVNKADEQARRLKLPLLKDISPIRALALVRLLRIEEGGAFADVLAGEGDDSWDDEIMYLERTLGFRTSPLDARDFRQVTDLVGGCVRWKKYLDFILFNFYSGDEREFLRIEPLLFQALRLGTYEILKTDKPPHVLNEIVQLVKSTLRPGAANLTNAMLRRIQQARDHGALPSPRFGEDERSRARALATVHSHPVWFVRRCLKRFGEKSTEKLLEWNNKRPHFFLRANSLKGISRENLVEILQNLEVESEPSLYLEDFLCIKNGMQNVLRAGLLANGTCTVQDESAGIVVSLLDPKPGEVLIDCCAAPGGKALFSAAKMEGKGKILAIDLNPGRSRMVSEAAERLSVGKMIEVKALDLRDFVVGNEEKGDRVLLDAPCSGLGVLSKRADLRWRRSPENIENLTILQDELLEAASKLVKPGGILVYSTCSIEPQENEERVEAFLHKHPEFEIESGAPFCPENMLTKNGFFASLPQRDGIDGAFAARLRLKTVV